MATYQALSPPTDPQKKLVYDQYPDVAGVSLNGSLAVPAVLYSSVVFEKKAHGTYPNLVNLSTGESQHGILHEVGHQFDYQAAAAPDKSINEDFVSSGRADQNYMTANAIGPTAAQLRSTHGYFIVASPPKFPEWTEIFAEQVAKLTNEANPSIGTPFTVDTEALSPYFKCTQVYTKAAITTGTAPTKANFDAVSASLYARCVAPNAPVACHTAPMAWSQLSAGTSIAVTTLPASQLALATISRASRLPFLLSGDQNSRQPDGDFMSSGMLLKLFHFSALLPFRLLLRLLAYWVSLNP